MNRPGEIDTLLRLLPTRQTFVVRYGITSILVLLSFAVRHGVGDLAGPYGFILFVPALVIASVAFGWKAGLFAVASSALVDGLWLDWSGPNFHATALATFVIIGAGLVFLGDALRRALEGLNRARNENQMLLDEMSHRVKNKFAMIISVISLQSRAAPLEARPALEAVARRVHALASVHTHLQGSRHRGLVEMEAYTGLGQRLTGERRTSSKGCHIDGCRSSHASAKRGDCGGPYRQRIGDELLQVCISGGAAWQNLGQPPSQRDVRFTLRVR